MEEDQVYLYHHPLRAIHSYDPSFKVDTRLHEPIWRDYFSYEEVLVEILSLCAALEPLCKKEYTYSRDGIEHDYKIEYLNKFEPQADVILKKMKEHLQELPRHGLSLKQFFKQSGLMIMYPRCGSYLMNSEKPMFRNQKSPIDGYFHQFATYNQVMRLSHQLNVEVNNLGNHKYVAHQTALLYQAVNQLGQAGADYKKDIEVHFKLIKEALGECGKDEVPKLSPNLKEWMNSITTDLIAELRKSLCSFPPPIRHCAQFLTQEVH